MYIIWYTINFVNPCSKPATSKNNVYFMSLGSFFGSYTCTDQILKDAVKIGNYILNTKFHFILHSSGEDVISLSLYVWEWPMSSLYLSHKTVYCGCW